MFAMLGHSAFLRDIMFHSTGKSVTVEWRCSHVGVVRCSQAAARVQRQQIFRAFEEIPSSISDTAVLKTLLPHCVAAGRNSGAAGKGYFNAVQYALTRQPMTKEV